MSFSAAVEQLLTGCWAQTNTEPQLLTNS